MSAGRPDWEPGFILAGQDMNVKVDVQGGEIDANITNAIINANIKQSEVTLEVSQLSQSIQSATLGDSPRADAVYRTPPTTQIAKVILRPGSGLLHQVCVWVKNPDTADHNLTISLKQRLDGPAVFSETITISAGYEGQKCVGLGFVWRWPQMIVELTGDLDTLQPAYNPVSKYDTYYYSAGQWVLDAAYSLCVIVDIYTFEQLPVLVQGWVIATRPPAKQYYFNKDWVSADPSSEVTILTIKGRGRLRYVLWIVADAGFADSVLRIYADGNVVTGYYFDGPGTLNYYGLVDKDTQPRLLKYDPNKPEAILRWDEEVEFHRELKLALHNYDSSNSSKIRILACHYVLE